MDDLQVGRVEPGHDPEHERTRLEALLYEEEQHRALAASAHDVFWVMAPDGRILYVSPEVEQARGITPDEAIRQTLDQIHPPEYQAITVDYYAQLHAAAEAGSPLPAFRGEMQYYRSDGSIFWGDLLVLPQVDDHGRLVEIVGVTRDITDRKQLEEQLRAANEALAVANAELRRLADTDPLTGVHSRRRFQTLADAELARAARTGRAPTLAMIDVDRFKEVNDVYGHTVGDTVLVAVCDRIRSRLRSTDALGRWGGEEFVVMLPETPEPEAVEVAETLRSLVGNTPFPDAGTVTISIGIATLRPGESFDAWITRADDALYGAKKRGRDAVVVAT